MNACLVARFTTGGRWESTQSVGLAHSRELFLLAKKPPGMTLRARFALGAEVLTRRATSLGGDRRLLAATPTDGSTFKRKPASGPRPPLR
jgi:hypothetical protein